MYKVQAIVSQEKTTDLKKKKCLQVFTYFLSRVHFSILQCRRLSERCYIWAAEQRLRYYCLDEKYECHRASNDYNKCGVHYKQTKKKVGHDMKQFPNCQKTIFTDIKPLQSDLILNMATIIKTTESKVWQTHLIRCYIRQLGRVID